MCILKSVNAFLIEIFVYYLRRFICRSLDFFCDLYWRKPNNMPRKFRKMCPSDYKDPTQSDSDHIVDPECTQKAQSEPTSSKICRDKLQKQSKSTPKSTQGEK